MTEYPLVASMTLGTFEPTEEQSALVTERIQALLSIYNDTPDEMKGTLVISFFVSLCMNSRDPVRALKEISVAVVSGINEFQAQQGKH